LAPQEATPDPNVQLVQNHQKALTDLMNANNRLLLALQKLGRVRTLQQDDLATLNDVKAAQASLDKSRADVQLAQRKANWFGTAPVRIARAVRPPAGSNLTPEQTAAIRNAQQRVMRLNEQVNVLQARLNQLGQDNAPAAAQQDVRNQVRQVSEELTQADHDLNNVLLTASLPSGSQISPVLRNQLSLAHRKVIDSSNQVQKAQRDLRRAREAREAGTASENDVQNVVSNLATAIQNFSAANTQLANLREMAYSTSDTTR
jgi:hypothetical protein